MTYERPCVDGLLLAKLREFAEQLVVTLPWREAEKARLELEEWVRHYFDPRPLRLVSEHSRQRKTWGQDEPEGGGRAA